MKKIIFYIVAFLSFLVFPDLLRAQSNGELISQGNKSYSEGRYNDAISLYSKVIDNRFESSELYYNLANAYFKANDIPSAILYYEKARKLNPKDDDINFNLNLANSRITDKIEPVPEFFLKRWWNDLINVFPVDAWGRICIITFLIALLCAAFFIISNSVLLRKLSFWIGGLLIFVSIFSFILGFRDYNRFIKHSEAIIFTSTVTVKSSPNDNSVDLFVIHEGTKVAILDKLGGWSEIHVANGSVGWVKDDVYRTI